MKEARTRGSGVMMEIYQAIVPFTPSYSGETGDDSSVDTSALLSFRKGEKFDVLSKETSKKWWPVRALSDDRIGFVPAEFMKVHEIRTEAALTDEDKVSREQHMRLLMELQQKSSFQHPDQYYRDMLPDPDYSDSDGEHSPQPANRLNSPGRLKPRHPSPPADINSSPEFVRRQKAAQNGSPEGRRRLKATLNGSFNDEGLIVPRKLSNPCLESRDRQELHRELKFNQKIGKNVLGQKTELQKVLDKFQDDQRKKEEQTEKLSKRSTLEMKLEEQANKIKQSEDVPQEKAEGSDGDRSEFMRIHAKVRAGKE